MLDAPRTARAPCGRVSSRISRVCLSLRCASSASRRVLPSLASYALRAPPRPSLRRSQICSYSFVLLSGSALVYLIIYKPLNHKKDVTTRQWFKLGYWGFVHGISVIAWHVALRYFGPIRYPRHTARRNLPTGRYSQVTTRSSPSSISPVHQVDVDLCQSTRSASSFITAPPSLCRCSSPSHLGSAVARSGDSTPRLSRPLPRR